MEEGGGGWERESLLKATGQEQEAEPQGMWQETKAQRARWLSDCISTWTAQDVLSNDSFEQNASQEPHLPRKLKTSGNRTDLGKPQSRSRICLVSCSAWGKHRRAASWEQEILTTRVWSAVVENDGCIHDPELPRFGCGMLPQAHELAPHPRVLFGGATRMLRGGF